MDGSNNRLTGDKGEINPKDGPKRVREIVRKCLIRMLVLKRP